MREWIEVNRRRLVNIAMNTEVLQSLTRLADKLAKLNETSYHEEHDDELINNGTASISLDENTSQHAPLPISHWRTLPPHVQSAYKLLNDGAEYIHATSTKYTLVGKVDHNEGGNLAIELRKGAELIGTGTLLLYSKSYGSSRSLKHYVKQSSRAILASVISLVKSFEDGVSQGSANDGNNVGAQKTGAVWSACDKLTKSLPRGNRAAMRRELMVWGRDCNESIEEFDEMLALGPREDVDEGEEEDAMMDEDQYTESEMRVAHASVNVMKCSKNLLGLVLKTCECVGEYADKIVVQEDGEASQDDATKEQQQQPQTDQNSEDTKRNEMLQWISNIHAMARAVGEGVTNLGVQLYPPLDSAKADEEEIQKWQEKKANASHDDDRCNIIPSLGSTALGIQIEHQLFALLECVSTVHDAKLQLSETSIQDCLSNEVLEGTERLTKALHVRCKDVEDAVTGWHQ